jgi:hypothetical protein
MSSQEENEAISALTGFSLNHVLDGLQLPAGTNLSNQLGISGIPALSSTQIYNDKWEAEDVIGADQGEDWEAEIDKEMLEEAEHDVSLVKRELMSPGLHPKQKRTRIVKRLVERPKSVYELFPSFDKGKILDFTEILKGNTARKSRLGKRLYLGARIGFRIFMIILTRFDKWKRAIRERKSHPRVSWMPLSVTPRSRSRVSVLRRLLQRAASTLIFRMP